MYNPKPQTRLEIMWAAMAGRDFDLDEKGRFEMFMSDVAERINAGGGGSFVFDLIDNDGELETETTPEDILQAAESGKALIAKVIVRTEEEGEVYESIEYYTITSTYVDSGMLIECVGLGNRPKYNSSTKQYMMSYIQYYYNSGWQVAQTPCSAQVLQNLNNVSESTVLSSTCVSTYFGKATHPLNATEDGLFQTELSNAIDEWKTLAAVNAGKSCVYSETIKALENQALYTTFSKVLTAFSGKFGVFDVTRYGSIFGVNEPKLRPVEYGTGNVLFHVVIDGPLGVPYDILLRIKTGSEVNTILFQVIGALPIDA